MTRSNGELATRDNRANMLRAFKASGCCVCGKRYPELDWSELQIDHIDPASAGKWDGRMNRMSTSEAIDELLKCQLLCTEHHLMKHRNGATRVGVEQLALFRGSGAWVYDNTNGRR